MAGDVIGGHHATGLVHLDEAEKARLLPVVFAPGSRSVMFRFPEAGRYENGDMFGAVIDEVTEQPDGQLLVQLWFWNDLARIYVTPGARFEIWYGHTAGEGLVLPEPAVAGG